MSRSISDIENTRAMWEACLNLLMPATSQLRTKLDLSEIEFRRIAHTATGKAKEVYFYRALDEIQKAGIALMHWKEFFSDLEKHQESEKQIGRVILEETMDNQSLRCRKLIELLVELILFQGTNFAPYYRDYLLIRELNEHTESQRDRDEFYGHENRNGAESIRFFIQFIRENEANIDPSRRWYLDKPEAAKPSWERHGVRLSSFRVRYSKAIKACEPAEFICLGKSYLHAYGLSREVHFSPQENSSSFSAEDCLQLADRCILLANHTLIRLARLMDVSDDKTVQQLIAANQLDETNLRLVREVSEQSHGVGDYVIVHSDPARVREVKKSKYGFIAYEVLYLGRPPMPHIKQEWFAAFEVRRFIPKFQVEAKMNEMLASLPAKAQPIIARFREPKERLKELDEGVLATWNAFRAGKLKATAKPASTRTEEPPPMQQQSQSRFAADLDKPTEKPSGEEPQTG